MRTNYILVDFENVQPDAMHLLDREYFKTIIFCGANQGKMNPAFVFSVQNNLGSKAKYIQISGNGKNALDFHIAFYIGQLAKDEPDAYFHIISSDTGFDPLIAHLKELKIFSERSKGIADIPIFKAANSKNIAEQPVESPVVKVVEQQVVKAVEQPAVKAVVKTTQKPAEKLAVIMESLQNMGIAKPKTVKKLLSTINSLFQNKLQGSELNALMQKLQKQGAISLNVTKVSYKLPNSKAKGKEA